MALDPKLHRAMDVALFDYATDWQGHDGTGQPVPDEALVKVMYSSGYVSAFVRCAYAWRYWTGGRDWWINPGDGRIYIIAYVVVG